jgi:hypothetical protein
MEPLHLGPIDNMSNIKNASLVDYDKLGVSLEVVRVARNLN